MPRLRKALFVAGCLTLMLTPAARAWQPEPGIGINVSLATSFTTAAPFADVFKLSSSWAPIPSTMPLQVDRLGWITALGPGQAALSTMFGSLGGRYPAGRYSVFYEGEGTLSFGRGVTVVSSRPGAMKIDVTPVPAGLQVRETATDPSNPLRNLRIVLPGLESTYQTQSFNPDYIKFLSPFKTIRLLPWQWVNRSIISNWSERRTPLAQTQSIPPTAYKGNYPSTGVALEYQIELANAVNADPWFNVPLRADDDYLQNMAKLIKAKLRPNLHPYIELSNEVWNGYFPEHAYAQQQGMAENLSPDDPKNAWSSWFARRSAQMFGAFDAVYGADAAKIVHVLGGAQTNPALTGTMLGYLKSNKLAMPDVVAVGAYVNPASLRGRTLPQAQDIAGMSVQQVLDEMTAAVDPGMANVFKQHVAKAKAYGVAVVVYEGGPGLGTASMAPPYNSKTNPVFSLFLNANRDAGIDTVINTLFDSFFGSGGVQFVYFDDISGPAANAMFGILESQFQDPQTSNKYGALRAYIKAHFPKQSSP